MKSICRVQTDILQLIISGEPLTVVAEKIVLWLESELGITCNASIFLINNTNNRLIPVAATSLPEEINKAITEDAFNTVFFHAVNTTANNQPVIIENVHTAPGEDYLKHLLLKNSILSCCCMPLVHNNTELRGMLLLLFQQPYTLSEANIELIQLAAQTTLLAIEINSPAKTVTAGQPIKNQLPDQSEERLQMAIESARMGTWNIDPFTKELTLSARERELHGFSMRDKVTLEKGSSLLPEEHRQKLEAAIEDTLTKGLPFELEYPVVTFNDRQIRWLKSTGKLFYNQDGKPITLSGTSIDITERKLEELRRNDFMAVASHELKTPLTSISAYMQVLSVRAEMIADITLSDIVDKCNRQVNKMTAMVHEFLDVSRIDAGKINLQMEAFDISTVIKEEVTEIRLTVYTHKIHLENLETIIIIADREKIARVMNNILRNAIKYSPRESTITVDVQKRKNAVTVKVTDEGIGINVPDQHKIFDRYYRIDNKNMSLKTGFGIGLYLAKQIIEMHKGKIGVKSKLNAGSTFYFTLPAEL